jgi:hypothetical protein
MVMTVFNNHGNGNNLYFLVPPAGCHLLFSSPSTSKGHTSLPPRPNKETEALIFCQAPRVIGPPHGLAAMETRGPQDHA